MRKTRAGGLTTSSELAPIENDSGSSDNKGSTSNNLHPSADFPLLEARIKHGRDEDTPINLVKDKRSHAIGEASKDINTCHENATFSNEFHKQHLLHCNTTTDSENKVISVINGAQNLVTDGLRKRTSVYDIKGNMTDSAESDNNHVKCSKIIEKSLSPPALEPRGDLQHSAFLPNQIVSVAAVGGMLAKQLESPLKSSYNNNLGSDKGDIRDELFSATGSHSSSRLLPPLTLTPSSSSVPSSSPSSCSDAVHSNLVFYTRSHNKTKDSSLNFGSEPSADLGTSSTMVVSNLVKNVNVSLEDETQSSSTSNYVVISDPESRHMESAGN